MSNRVVELLINLKTKGASEVDKLISSIRGLDSTASSSGRGVEDLAKSTESASKSSGSLGKTARELADEVKGAGDSASKASDSFGDFQDSAKQSEGLSSRLGGSIGKLRLGFVGLAAAAVGALGAFASTRGISSAADQFDLMSNAAERARTSVENLQAVEYAAGTVAGKSWEDMSKAMDTMGRRISRFATEEGGPAANVLKQLNINADELADMDAVDQMKELADAMKDMSNIERQDALFQIGGDNLKDLANSMKDSNDQLFELIDKAKEANYVLSDIEADQLASLNGELTDMGQAFQAMRQRWLAQLAPVLEVTLGVINSLIRRFTDFGKNGTTVSENIAKGIDFLVKGFNIFRGVILNVISVQASLGAGLLDIIEHFGVAISHVVNFVLKRVVQPAFNGILNLAQKVTGILGRFVPAIANLNERIQDLEINIPDVDAKAWASRNSKKMREGAEATARAAEEAFNAEFSLSGKLKTYYEERDAEKDAADAQDKIDKNGPLTIDLEVQAQIESAMKALAETRQKIEADAQRAITRQRMQDIDHEQAVALKNLEAQRNAGEISSEEYYARRLELEKEHNERVAEMRKSLIDLDIEAVRRQKKALENMLGDLEQGGAEYLSVVQQIEEAEARIKGLQFDVKNIDQAVRYKNELSQIAEAERQREELRKQAEQAEQDDLERREELAAKMAEQERMVAELKLDLLRQTGNEAEAQFIELKNQYGDMLQELEGNSEGAQLIEKLLDMKVAQVELDEFKKQLEELRAAYELGDISRAEYNRGVEALTPDLNAAAIRTGNEEIIQSTQRMAEEYRNFGDVAYQVGGVVGNRFMGLTDGLHDAIMGTQSLRDAFHQMAAGIIADLMRMIIQQQIFNALQAASGAIGGGFGAALGSIGLNHTGGFIGSGSARRSVPMSMFAGAPRYHTGGLIGADEVPIIAQKGEYMLDKYDIRNPKNGGTGATPAEGGGSGQAVNITNVVDSASIAGAMDTPDGRNAIVNIIRAERATIKSIL